MKSYNYVTIEAATDENMTVKESLLFHAFNKNGLCAQKTAVNARIDALVDSGKVPFGWIMAYGVMNYYYENQIIKLVGQKTNPSRVSLFSILKCFKEELQTIETKLESVA